MFFLKKNTYSIINNHTVETFIHAYAHKDNWHNLNTEKGNLGYGWIHYAFIRNLTPSTILTIGSRYGFIPAICALACKDNRKGKVYFVDANYDQSDSKQTNNWGGVGFWTKKNIKKQFDAFKLTPYIKTHIMTTDRFFQNHQHIRWGYIHIDGDHSYTGVKMDFMHSWDQLIPGGIIALHDIHTNQQHNPPYGVQKLWLELKKSRQYNMFELPGAYGLGFIQKNE